MKKRPRLTPGQSSAILAQKLHGVADQMLHHVVENFVPIPRASCACGKSIIFSATKPQYTCTRCNATYQLVVEVKKVVE